MITFDSIPLDAQFVGPLSGKRFAHVGRTERQQVARRAVAFGVFDAKGREIGYSYAIDREFHVIDADSRRLFPLEQLDLVLEESFIVYPQGTRDGLKFGALPVASYRRFKSMAEAEAYAEAGIERSRKAAAKKASA